MSIWVIPYFQFISFFLNKIVFCLFPVFEKLFLIFRQSHFNSKQLSIEYDRSRHSKQGFFGFFCGLLSIPTKVRVILVKFCTYCFFQKVGILHVKKIEHIAPLRGATANKSSTFLRSWRFPFLESTRIIFLIFIIFLDC